MDFSRYTSPDAYTLEELRREYQRTDSKGRIHLLRKLYSGDRIAAFEIALLAVQDENVEVRQWIAREGKYLDYRDDGHENLEDRLRNDPDPFVRACLRENPTVFNGWGVPGWIEHFRQATHMERLALMRNPEIGNAHGESLIQKVFDYEDQELGIDLEAQKELILAFFTNREVVSRSQRLKVGHFIDGLSMLGARAHYSHLWKLISKWPKGTGNLQHAVYRYVGAPDETKAEIYQACDEPVWRRAILEGCNTDDFQTIELGMKDPDDGCREIAYRKFNPRSYTARIMTNLLLHGDAPASDRALAIHGTPAFVDKKLQSVLEGEDKAALSGLAENRSLSLDFLRKVRGRLVELGDDISAHWAGETIGEIEKVEAPGDPNELFDEPGKFTAEKIDFIGRSILAFQKELRGLERTIVWIAAIIVVVWLGRELLKWVFGW